MNAPFTHSTVWHNDVFAIDLDGAVYRFERRFDNGPSTIVHIYGRNAWPDEFYLPIQVLHAMREASRS